MKLHIAVDSGAYSHFAKHHKKSTHFFDSQEFTDYLDKYRDWLRANAGNYEFCVALDVIGNADATYSNWKEMCKHLRPYIPMPVIHLNEDPANAKKYLDKTDYIAFGGMARTDFSVYRHWVAKAFAALPPGTRVHGFAVTSFNALVTFPWYSVDSTSPILTSLNGNIVLPGGGGKPFAFAVSKKTDATNHVHWQGVEFRKRIQAELARCNFTIDDVSGQQYVNRYIVNYLTLNRIAERNNVRYYLSGHPNHIKGSGWPELLVGLSEHSPSAKCYHLASFFYLKELEEVTNAYSRLTTHAQTGERRLAHKGLHPSTHAPVLRTKARFRVQ